MRDDPAFVLEGVLLTEHGDMPWTVSFYPSSTARPYWAWAEGCIPRGCESLDRALAAIAYWSLL